MGIKAIFTTKEVADTCRRFGSLLHLSGVTDQGQLVDPVKVMWAFSQQECIHRLPNLRDCTPRHEPAYDRGGRYCTSGSKQEQLIELFGSDGAKSYGCWQVMLVNAATFKPEDFERIETGAQAFIDHTNRVISSQAPSTLAELADAYNSGNFRDRNVPAAYIAAVCNYYRQATAAMPAA